MPNFYAEFYLTDGTEFINLLSQRNGFTVRDWIPAAPEPKGGGIFQDSALSEGRRLVAQYDNNVIDQFTLVGKGGTADELIYVSQAIRRLLKKAITYFTAEWQDTPVYLLVRGAGESKVRYAMVYDYRAPGDGNPFASPFASPDESLFAPWNLIIEHAPWQGNPPGEGDCVEISGQSAGWEGNTHAYPVDNTDDAYVNETGSLISTSSVFMVAGNSGSILHSGIRFQNVLLPAGATITKAEVRLRAVGALTGAGCALRIYGELNATPATFSTYANFAARTLTTNYTNWNPPAQSDGELITTPDLAPTVQEIVDLGGWASGGDIVLFLRDNGSVFGSYRGYATLENTSYGQAELYVTYTVAAPGQDATCMEKVYASGCKQNKANISHLFYYDASLTAYSGNLIGGAWPAAILPATPAAGDMIYLGSDTSLSDSGPFNSVVWKISTLQNDLTEVIYEYWDGATWSSFIAILDNTGLDVGGNTIPFSILGIGSWHWNQPSGWGTTAINGVTAFWFRMRIVSVGAAPSAPQQDSRDPYTITWGHIEIAASAVLGDLPPLARLKALNETELGAAVPGGYNRLFVGLRSASRGLDFSAYLNASDEQNPEGLTVSALTGGAFADDTTAPTGRRVTCTNSGGVRFAFSTTLLKQYYGRFRIFGYLYQSGGSAGDYYATLKLYALSPYYVVAKTSKNIYTATTGAIQIVDFGQYLLPPTSNMKPDEIADYFRLEFTVTGTGTCYLYQLFLLPVDELAVEVNSQNTDNYVSNSGIGGDYVTFDSLTKPKVPLRSFVYSNKTGAVQFAMQPVNVSKFMLQANAQQRLWFMGSRINSASHFEWMTGFNVANSISLSYTPRYQTMRGNQ